jgi:hypothetical protein
MTTSQTWEPLLHFGCLSQVFNPPSVAVPKTIVFGIVRFWVPFALFRASLPVVCCFKRRWSIASQEDPICGSIFKRIYGYLASSFGAIFAPISRLNKPPV